MSDLNVRCDGAHCTEADGEVRKYPVGEPDTLSSVLHLCHECFINENKFRTLSHWPVRRWQDAEVYPVE